MSDTRRAVPALVGSLGVVFCDIGTSPLYALKESLDATGAQAGDAGAVRGVLSLITWSLFVVVTLKYVTLMLRADNQGEGGILALFALVQKHIDPHSPRIRWVAVLALAGAALFYCDALITPAITVLSAVEGMELLDPGFERVVIPVTLGILIALFAIQRRGTDRVARLCGPVMLVWFVAIGATGLNAIVRGPGVLAALDPRWATWLLASHPGLGLAILGAVFLALTGGEALYADMGHFGKRPVRRAWFGLVWPALMLNYYGQGAAARASGVDRTSAVFPRAAAGAAAARAARDRGVRDRLPGRHHRDVLGHAPGRAARPAAAHACAADFGARARADLRTGRQRTAPGRRDGLRARVRYIRCAVGRLRRRGGRHHVRDDAARRGRGAHGMALAGRDDGDGVRQPADRRCGIRLRQHDQAQ